MSSRDAAPGEGTSVTGATLAELSEKLTTLREHLDQLLADLGSPHRANGLGRTDLRPATLGRALGNTPGAGEELRCHRCGRAGSKGAVGWTLRLCADDELHAFCADCDCRHFNGDGGGAEPDPVPQGS